jgi:hypothetical protein
VRIVTRDAAALAAVQAFLHFQIADHQTGDSGSVQQPSAPGRTMNGLGPGMMMMHGRQDAGAMAQMHDIHALFANHDRMTRTVTNLPDGIRTVTESNDPQVVAALQQHAAEVTEFINDGMAAMHKAMGKTPPPPK